jgi:translation initiation factor 1
VTRRDDRPTVYSTESGDQRKKKAALKRRPTGARRSLPPDQQTAYLHRDSKGRGGKVVSLVKNLQLNEKDLLELAKKLKQACGAGGAVKDGVIEIQGENRARIAEVLEKLGYKTVIAGG